MIESLISYIQSMASYAEQNYHVDPWLFIFLMTVSTPIYYLGYYFIGSSLIKVENKKIMRRKIDKNRVRKGVVITVFGWFFPYVYVMIFGKLPLWLWIILLMWLFALSILLVRSIRTKVQKTKEGAEV